MSVRSFAILSTIALFAVAPVLSGAAPPKSADNAPERVKPAPAQVRLEMHLTRTEKEGAAPGAGSTSLPPATLVPPAIASPTLTTLDRGTATVTITNKELSYSISASPSIEQTDKASSTVQVLWNVRLSGRSLPGDTNSVTTTGATRIDPAGENESLLTELPITDTKTGRVSLFRLTVRVIVTPADSPGPKVGTVSPTPSAAP